MHYIYSMNYQFSTSKIADDKNSCAGLTLKFYHFNQLLCIFIILFHEDVWFSNVNIYFCLWMSDIFKNVATCTFSLITVHIKLYSKWKSKVFLVWTHNKAKSYDGTATLKSIT